MAERNVVISGVGQSDVGKRVARGALALTIDAVKEALDDAGLSVADIDGLSSFPGYRPDQPGFAPFGLMPLKEAMGFRLNWFSGGGEGPVQMQPIIDGYAAIKAGLARHVLCFRTVQEGSGGRSYANTVASVERPRAGGDFQWIHPFDAPSAVNWLALHAQRHFTQYGTTREQLAQVALVQRNNARLNPKAIFTDPMSLDDYMGARMISTPLCLFDCDAPTDASTVLILSADDAARDTKSRPLRIEAISGALHSDASWAKFDIARGAAFDSAQRMWAATDLKPGDIDVALLYDGFSFLTLRWIEALGLCGVGEGGAFIEGGHRIGRDGSFPINPHGGQLSAGRTHGFGFAHEAVLQLRGAAGARQLPRDLSTAVVAMGGGPKCGCMLLVKD
ncbi:MAG: thiolase family protein [Sphingobium sp.]